MSRNSRIAVLVGAVLVLIVGFVVASSNGGSNKAKHTSGHAFIYIVNGKPRGGIQTLVYNKGDQVMFTVVSDVSDEIHVHGFNFKKEVKKGGSVTFSFPATDQGDHVVELESRNEQIANLRVL
jgi:heme/copper-type cytochrome/quinol oxidase subunit 2